MGHVGRAEDGVEAAGRRYDLSGAVADGDAAEETERAGLNPLEHLDNNDSYTLFHELDRAVYAGPTGTNVNDVFIALVCKT
jgi:glycerate-2-kinase